jgi:membrane protein
MISSMTSPSARTGSLAEGVALSMRTLRTWPWFDTLRTLRQRFREDRLGITAGSLTFTTLIALVPLVTVMLAVFSVFPIFASFQGALEKYFLQSLVPETIARPVLRALTQFAGKASQVGALGLAMLGATALAMMMTIDRTLNSLWRVRKPRPLAQRVLVYWAALTLAPLVLGVSLTMTSYALSSSRGFVSAMPGGLSMLLNAFEFTLLASAMAGLFHYVPNTFVRWRHAWAGALFVAIAFEVAKRALAWYVEAVPVFTSVYGAFATLPILLLWIYLGWVIVLLGAVIAAYAPSLQTRVARRPETPGHRFQIALAVLRLLDAARRGQQRGMSMTALSEALRADPLQLEPVVDCLIGIDCVARVDEGGDQRLVLLGEPAAMPAAPLIDSLLLQPASESLSFSRRAGLSKLRLADLLE